ncbi:MAG: type II/IV secretion system protein, partial [Nitrospirae bacterium]|nr:type II/IV secretion system protein [Nitrospirota bacterium]
NILVENNFITETDLVEALSVQLGFPKITPNVALIDKKLVKALNKTFLMTNIAIPAFKQDDIVTVIMADPLDEGTILSFEKVFKAKIEPAISHSAEIIKAINSLFQEVDIRTDTEMLDHKKDLVIGATEVSSSSGDDIIGIVNYIITNGILEEASDIHIEPQERRIRVRYRVDGILKHVTDLPVSINRSLSSRIKVLCGLDISERRRHQDGRIEAKVMKKEVDLRISTYASMWGENIVIRVLHRQSKLVDLKMLGFSPFHMSRYMKILDQPTGICMITGPTGSGKTTTLYASLLHLNDTSRCIITVEDPVEYTIEGITQGKLDPKLNLTYSDFLKSIMRQDPDVIMVGEIRDRDAANAVIQASLTGHKLLTTFHTDDTTGALLRLMDMGVETFLISSTIVSVVSQRLVRVLCKHCTQPYTPDDRILSAYASTTDIVPDRYNFHRPVGCHECGNTGYKGRIGIHELLVVNAAIRDAILERMTSSRIRNIARKEAHLISMVEDGFIKATKGITSLEEIFRVVMLDVEDTKTMMGAEELIALSEKEV